MGNSTGDKNCDVVFAHEGKDNENKMPMTPNRSFKKTERKKQQKEGGRGANSPTA